MIHTPGPHTASGSPARQKPPGAHNIMSATLQPTMPEPQVDLVTDLGWDSHKDIEMGASRGPPLADCGNIGLSPVREKSIVREKNRTQHTLRLLKTQSTAQISMKKNKSKVQNDNWDVFISYRVNADAKLAEDLYWKLLGSEIVDHSSTRRLRVFWDKGCCPHLSPRISSAYMWCVCVYHVKT